MVDGTPYTLTHSYTYDTKHRPVEVWTTLPAAPGLGDLSGQLYKTKAHYDDVTGVQTSTEFLTAMGGLPAETVTTGFDRLGRGVQLTVGANNFQLVKGVTWDATGLLLSRTYGDDAVRSLQYDRGTRSVSRMIASGGGVTFQDDLYVRDGDTGDGVDPLTVGDGTIDAVSTGTLTSITDAANASAPVSQCYAYNGLNRLESAWTITGAGSGCAASFAETASGSLDTSDTAYATAWEYATAGSIVSVDDLLAETARVYDQDEAHPAAVAAITNPDIPAIPAHGEDPEVPEVPVADDTFTYDALGRMIERVTYDVDPVARTVTPHTLTLSWDASSNLVKTDLDGAEVVYLYDSSGQRVAQLGVTAGTATAYLGATEVTDPNTGTSNDLQGTRYYSLGGATVAVRQAPTTSSPEKLSFLLGDVQGSAQVMVTHTVDPVTHQISATPVAVANAYTPYGTTRGADDLTISHGWLNQVSDEASTGLVYLNARYYDPAVARFLSPDPLMNPSDPKTLDPYRYAENNPVTYTDASGLGPVCTGLSGTALTNCQAYGNNTANYMTGETKAQRTRVEEQKRRQAAYDDARAGRYSQVSRACRITAGLINANRASLAQRLIGLGNYDNEDIGVAVPLHGVPFSGLQAKAATDVPAYAIYAFQLRSKGPWDLKGPIEDELGIKDKSHWLQSDDHPGEYLYYDTPGNVHLGFISADAGLEFREVLELSRMPGAGAQSPADDLSTEMGYELFERVAGRDVTAQDVEAVINDYWDELRAVGNVRDYR